MVTPTVRWSEYDFRVLRLALNYHRCWVLIPRPTTYSQIMLSLLLQSLLNRALSTYFVSVHGIIVLTYNLRIPDSTLGFSALRKQEVRDEPPGSAWALMAVVQKMFTLAALRYWFLPVCAIRNRGARRHTPQLTQEVLM
jgi:hypothetical protein